MKVKWNVRARNKLQQIVNYIAEDNPTAAIKYGNEIFSRTEKLLEFPNAGFVYQVNGQHIIRKIVIGKTKTIFYRATDNAIYILALHDNRQLLKRQKK
jgi:plasmid stabilization system protein ParE